MNNNNATLSMEGFIGPWRLKRFSFVPHPTCYGAARSQISHESRRVARMTCRETLRLLLLTPSDGFPRFLAMSAVRSKTEVTPE